MDTEKTDGREAGEALQPLPRRRQKGRAEILEMALAANKSADDFKQHTKKEALAILGKKRAEQARLQRRRLQEAEGVLYYAECTKCQGPAYFMTKRPSGPLGPNDWYATYKPTGVPFHGNFPYCQCCDAESGDMVPQPILHFAQSQHDVNGRFRPLPRLVRTIDQNDIPRSEDPDAEAPASELEEVRA